MSVFLIEYQVFLHSIKTRARLHGIQVMMAHDQRFGEQEVQLAQQCQHTSFLHQCAGVGRGAVRRESAFIADAYRVAVMVLAVRSRFLQGASAVDLSVAGDVEMVSYVRETTVADVILPAGLKSRLRPSGVAEQWMIIRVMVLMVILYRRSVPARWQGRWLR